MLPMPFPSSRMPASSAAHQLSSAPSMYESSPAMLRVISIASRTPFIAEKATTKAQTPIIESAARLTDAVNAAEKLTGENISSS